VQANGPCRSFRRPTPSRTAVRDALAKLIADGELVQLVGRKRPRGETYYHLPAAARYLAEQAAAGEQDPTLPGVRMRPTGGRNPALLIP